MDDIDKDDLEEKISEGDVAASEDHAAKAWSLTPHAL